MQEIIQDRNYFIESNYLRITKIIQKDWKLEVSMLTSWYTVYWRICSLIQSFQHMNAWIYLREGWAKKF